MKHFSNALQRENKCILSTRSTFIYNLSITNTKGNASYLKSKTIHKFFLLLLTALLLSLTGYCQSYLGTISKQVNLREGPGTDYQIITSLKPKTQIFVVSLETEDDFYSIIDIATDKSGYVHKNYVVVGKELSKSEGGFTPTGKSGQENPEAEVFNNTNKSMTLKLNSNTYTFKAKEKKTLALSASTYSFIASAPGVIPNFGSKTFERNTLYTWEFYIVTKYR